MLELLEMFCAVAEAGSLNKAAERLHLTQPAVTRQVKVLEGKLGVVLLTRTKQGVRLTPAGEAVLKHARQAVAAAAACYGAASAFSADRTECLRVAAGLHVAMYYLPQVLARFRELNPSVKIDLRPAPHRQAIERLLSYEVDLALVGFDVPVPGIRQIPLIEDPLVLVAPGATDTSAARLTDLEGANLLVLPPDSAFRREIDWVLERHSLACTLIELPNAELLKSAAALGMGIAILPRTAARAEADAGTLVIRELVDWPEPVRMIRACVRAEGGLPSSARAFLQMLRS